MLLSFTVGNCLSIRERQTFAMTAAPHLHESSIESLAGNSVEQLGVDVLKSAAIFGANASGKSNFIIAAQFFRNFVLSSSKDTQAGEKILLQRFELSSNFAEKPAIFEIVFICEGRKYRYGFEVTDEIVAGEWLYHVPSKREAMIFERDYQVFTAAKSFGEIRGLETKIRSNALLLSVIAQFNGKISTRLLDWFKSFRIVSTEFPNEYRGFTEHCLAEGRYVQRVKSLMGALDFGIDDFSIRTKEYQLNSFEEGTQERIKELLQSGVLGQKVVDTVHKVFNDSGEQIGTKIFQLDYHESTGTQKLFRLAGPMLDALSHGYVVMIDEFEANLHPHATRKILELFNSAEFNPKNAQLIFTTHDTTLLDPNLLRRDQVWFMEKGVTGASVLTSLAEFKGVRSDTPFAKLYLQGRFGAIPYIGSLDLGSHDD